MVGAVKRESFSLDSYLNDWAADWDLFSEKTLETIAHRAEEVSRQSGKLLDCGENSSLWYSIFSEEGITVRMLSGYYHENLNSEGQVKHKDGSITSPPLSADHVWLEVEGHLLDATASQFVSPDRPFSRDNYFPEEYYNGPPGSEEDRRLWLPA